MYELAGEAIFVTREHVTRGKNCCRIASLVTKIVINANPYILLYGSTTPSIQIDANQCVSKTHIC